MVNTWDTRQEGSPYLVCVCGGALTGNRWKGWICYVWNKEPGADQDGFRKSLFNRKVISFKQDSRKCKSTESQVKQNSQIRNQKSEIKNQESEWQAKQTRSRQESLLLSKGCHVLSLNKLAYKNWHRVKINILTVWQMNRLEYIYTGILTILRGLWDVRKD